MSRRLAIASLAVLALGGAWAGRAAAARPRVEVSNAVVHANLAAGRPVVYGQVRIRGLLDLSDLETVDHPFKCRNCEFDGGLIASGVVFTRTVDLSGSEIRGPLAMQGATFKGPALFGTPPGGKATVFVGATDFSLASFEDLTTFQYAVFAGHTDFTLARFRADAIFIYAAFRGQAAFRVAAFGGATRFERATFADGADFERTSFAGSADFRGGAIRGPASFERVDFRGRADFSLREFDGEAIFNTSRFLDGGTFIGTEFRGQHVEQAVSFDHASAPGSGLDFSSAALGNIATFNSVTAGAVSLRSMNFLSGSATLTLTDLTAADFRMDVGSVSHVAVDDRRLALRLIESTAKARDDLGPANTAHYALRALEGDHYAWPVSWLDWAGYRWAAGYLVRPTHPLVALVALVLLTTIIRVRRPLARAARHARRRGFHLERVLRQLLGQFLDTLWGIFTRASGKRAGLARLEYLVYRLLVACFLLGLANSNPTLRQLVDAII